MFMDIEQTLKRIERYLKKSGVGAMIADVQNSMDLNTLIARCSTPENVIMNASDARFCHEDEIPSVADILNLLSTENKNFFICEVSSFCRLKGEKALTETLREFLAANIAGHAVIITYQCEQILQSIIKNDKRLETRISIVTGEKAALPQIAFTAKGINLGDNYTAIHGINSLAKAVESEISDTICIETGKSKSSYPNSLYAITDVKRPYDFLCMKDNATMRLSESAGTEELWRYAVSELSEYSSWERLISEKIGDIHRLNTVIYNYRFNHDNNRLWLYFIGLKLFGAENDPYLDNAAKKADTAEGLLHHLYRDILEFNPHDKEFARIYEHRKELLNAIGNPLEEVCDFCKIVLVKEREALYYLTDNTVQEKELMFKLLDKYGLDFDKPELMTVIQAIYPELYKYLTPYRFRNDLLDSYFQDYKYQKVINKILPEFMNMVNRQAVEREYNAILPPRSSVVEHIDTAKTQTYFTDAMGAEYLGYITSKCQELELSAKVTVSRAELPSITSRNKEFWDTLSTEQYPIITFDKLDKIKHHGEEGYDYSKESKKLPIHLIRELELIGGLLEKIKADIAGGTYDKAVLISDHGASRLAVIHETECLWEMGTKGQHSGRCCPKSELDERPASAADADDFWSLANYDRFKGGRKASVEVHGGATLEEVVVPIIEISCLNTAAVEIKILPLDAPASFDGIPEIAVSYRKKAAVKIFSTQRLTDVTVEIDGHTYEAKEIGDNFYAVEAMPEIRRPKTYMVNVYDCGSMIASALPLKVKKEGISEKSIL